MTDTANYSQNNEQEIIHSLFDRLGLTSGKLLDIGAYLPDTFSNSRALIDKGWSAVLVEPSPVPFQALLKHYAANKKVTLVNAAVSTVVEWLTFYDSNGDALSTSSQEHLKKWNTTSFTPYELMAVSIDSILTRFGSDYDFLSLDVESNNLSLFFAFPWYRMTNLKVICVEHDNSYQAMESLVEPLGFRKIAQNAENIILSRIS